MTDWSIPRMCTVESVTRDSVDVFTLGLSTPDGDFEFAPGQFNMLYAPNAGESAISISGDPGDRAQVVHTIRALGNVTGQFDKLTPGDRIGLRGPFGQGWPVEAAHGRDLLIMAGGIGLAPLMPVLHTVAAAPDRFGRVTLLYGVRSPGDILFQDQLLEWNRSGAFRLKVTVDAVDDGWHGDVGAVTILIRKARFRPAETTVLICGPEVMMRYSALGLIERGVSPADIHVSMERNMQCATGLCGHCQIGPHFVCKDGPVFPYPAVSTYFAVREF